MKNILDSLRSVTAPFPPPPDFQLASFDRFRAPRKWFRLSFLVVLIIAALIDFFSAGLARKTFVFYAIDDGVISIESRMLKLSGNRERDITRYVEEALLGPITPNSLLLFPREAKLSSVLYDDGVVYVNFSEEAALPPLQGGEVFTNMNTLHSGIMRNFPFVKDVRLFIAGRPAYAAELRQAGEFTGLDDGL